MAYPGHFPVGFTRLTQYTNLAWIWLSLRPMTMLPTRRKETTNQSIKPDSPDNTYQHVPGRLPCSYMMHLDHCYTEENWLTSQLGWTLCVRTVMLSWSKSNTANVPTPVGICMHQICLLSGSRMPRGVSLFVFRTSECVHLRSATSTTPVTYSTTM